MHILAVITGDYGTRHVENIRSKMPAGWSIEAWDAPTLLPLIIDYPEDYLPESLPAADLVLALAEHKGVAELVPEIAQMTGAKAVIAPVDNEAWLPRGLARQLRGWLERQNVVCVTPKPFCSLTETHYDVTRRERITYQDPLISEFAKYFGRPAFEIEVDPETRVITAATARRDAACGCASFAAERLVGISADEAEQEGGMFHHHYPCLASMGIDVDFSDTLMHVSGNIMRDEIAGQVKAYKRVNYIAPGTRSEEPEDQDEDQDSE
jgi:hypothetical protein